MQCEMRACAGARPSAPCARAHRNPANAQPHAPGRIGGHACGGARARACTHGHCAGGHTCGAQLEHASHDGSAARSRLWRRGWRCLWVTHQAAAGWLGGGRWGGCSRNRRHQVLQAAKRR